MFRHNGQGDFVLASAENFFVEMQAIDLKEDFQRLQRRSRHGEALPFMLRSVPLKENSHTLCLSLS